MLPFTKRPGRSDDSDVITKDDLVNSPARATPASAIKRSSPPPSRAPAPSVGDDEMTSILQSRSLAGPVSPVVPAAGRPATLPPPSRSRSASLRPPPSSVRPPPQSSQRSVSSDEDADDDEDGRTVVRGAPKIVKRSNPKSLAPPTAPTSISPAAVIKATLESARAQRRDNLIPGPPSDLLEDRSDFGDASSQRTPFFGRGQPVSSFEGPPPHRPPQSYAPPPSSHPQQYAYGGPRSAPPGSAPISNYPAGNTSYGPVPNASVSVPGVAMPASMPAHFMTPQAPYSDPPGTAVTSGHRVAGRPAMSWAAALLACGLFVGVAAVAVVQSSDTYADITASFVDPSRAPTKAAAQPGPALAPVPVQVAPNGAPAVAAANPKEAPPGLIGASPAGAAPPPPAAAEQPAVAVAPVVTTPRAQAVAFAPVAVPSAPAAKPAAPPPAARPAFTWKPPAAPAAAAPAPKPASKPAVATASNDDDSPKPDKKKGSKAGKAEPDEETKKALEALQKAQLESASSFGKD